VLNDGQLMAQREHLNLEVNATAETGAQGRSARDEHGGEDVDENATRRLSRTSTSATSTEFLVRTGISVKRILTSTTLALGFALVVHGQTGITGKWQEKRKTDPRLCWI
jgi:hypothetical protein